MLFLARENAAAAGTTPYCARLRRDAPDTHCGAEAREYGLAHAALLPRGQEYMRHGPPPSATARARCAGADRLDDGPSLRQVPRYSSSVRPRDLPSACTRRASSSGSERPPFMCWRTSRSSRASCAHGLLGMGSVWPSSQVPWQPGSLSRSRRCRQPTSYGSRVGSRSPRRGLGAAVRGACSHATTPPRETLRRWRLHFSEWAERLRNFLAHTPTEKEDAQHLLPARRRRPFFGAWMRPPHPPRLRARCGPGCESALGRDPRLGAAGGSGSGRDLAPRAPWPA